MIKIENVELYGWDPAIRGMRNPLNSWNKSDSELGDIGPADLDLMARLATGGPVHAKYRRMIVVYMDITAPLYWWKEFDTYRVGVTPNPIDIEMNSCSTMHTIHKKEFEHNDFSMEHLDRFNVYLMDSIISNLNYYRNAWIKVEKRLQESRDGVNNIPLDQYSNLINQQKEYWWQMIQLLPASYNQCRTVMLNYEVLHNMYTSRKNHKLDEWRELCRWIESLPYFEKVIAP